MAELVRSARDGAVLVVTFDRPDRKNALSVAMYETFVAALREADADPGIRVVRVRAEGSAFTSGNDLMDFAQRPPRDESSPVLQLLRLLVDFSKPLVMTVQGPAVGIGTTMLLHADLIYAAPEATFKLPFVPLGLVPEAGSSWLLPRIAGMAAAAELLLLGETFDAARAAALGIVTALVPADALDAHAHAKAQALAALPPAAVRQTKALLRAPLRDTLHRVVGEEGRLFVERLGSPETAEAIRAFLEKRPADFSRFS